MSPKKPAPVASPSNEQTADAPPMTAPYFAASFQKFVWFILNWIVSLCPSVEFRRTLPHDFGLFLREVDHRGGHDRTVSPVHDQRHFAAVTFVDQFGR